MRGNQVTRCASLGRLVLANLLKRLLGSTNTVLEYAKSMRSPMNSVDSWLSAADHALRTLSDASVASRPYPASPSLDSPLLDADERKLSGALMRVNHVGEICAQALYQAQALATRDDDLREHFRTAAREETDHLAWTRRRLSELGDRPSLLAPLWYLGAFGIGLLAGHTSDATSLGFVVETERQVERHLQGHLERLPAADLESRQIVAQMKEDEGRHAREAQGAGAVELPLPVKLAMRATSKVMTTIAHRI